MNSGKHDEGPKRVNHIQLCTILTFVVRTCSAKTTARRVTHQDVSIRLGKVCFVSQALQGSDDESPLEYRILQ